jgi:hypothetical protein
VLDVPQRAVTVIPSLITGVCSSKCESSVLTAALEPPKRWTNALRMAASGKMPTRAVHTRFSRVRGRREKPNWNCWSPRTKSSTRALAAAATPASMSRRTQNRCSVTSCASPKVAQSRCMTCSALENASSAAFTKCTFSHTPLACMATMAGAMTRRSGLCSSAGHVSRHRHSTLIHGFRISGARALLPLTRARTRSGIHGTAVKTGVGSAMQCWMAARRSSQRRWPAGGCSGTRLGAAMVIVACSSCSADGSLKLRGRSRRTVLCLATFVNSAMSLAASRLLQSMPIGAIHVTTESTSCEFDSQRVAAT